MRKGGTLDTDIVTLKFECVNPAPPAGHYRAYSVTSFYPNM